MFVLVREVVVCVERNIVVSNFGGHWRSPELAAAGKMFYVWNFMRSLLE